MPALTRAEKRELAKRTARNKQGLRRVFSLVWKHYKFLIILVFLLILVSSAASVFGSVFQRNLIDDYITPMLSQSNPDYGPLASALVYMAGIYAAGIVSTYAWNRLMVTISLGTLNTVREDLFKHMETLPIRYFDTHAHGDIMSVYTNDTDTMRQLISQSVPNVISSLVTIIMVIISMLSLCWQLAIVTLIMSCFMLGAARYLGSYSGKYFRTQQRQLGQLNGYIEEMIEGIRVVKVFSHEQQSVEGFEKLNNELCEASSKANIYGNILMPICANIGYVSYLVTAIVGAYFAINNLFGMTLGTISAFLVLNRSFNMPINQISQQINAVVMAGAGSSRVFALLDEPSEGDQGVVSLVRVRDVDGKWVETHINTGHWCWKHPRPNGQYDLIPLKGDVTFNDVTFGYNPDKTVLFDINLEAVHGQKVAFVGATGAGKTTITNLINRFYDIHKGSITYDGINIELIKKPDLRKSLGLVLQDTQLFTGSVIDNIRFGKLEATDEECIAAAKLANADGFINHLEDGYETILTGGGENLSQGQRQLLAIARAAVANPPVLILDEATSSIDTRTERLVQDGMDALMKGRTVFVIAHRLSTIMNSDKIMVLDHGKIIERGTHDELIKQKGVYYQLYTGALEMD